jgi:DNA replication and repair protein RecF
MFLKNIKINNFRNIQNENINFSKNINIIYGENGNGKTNLLESIYYTTSLKPIKKNNKLIHLINKNSQYSIIKSTFENNNYKEIIKISITPEKKILFYNQNTNTNIQIYLHKFKSVLFTPDDLMIVKGEPQKRRDFFNKAIFHLNQSYYNSLIEYNKILKTRNKILKNISEGNNKQLEILEILNEQFTDISLKIYQDRINYLIKYIPIWIDIVNQLSTKNFLPYLIYKTDFDYKNRDNFINKLKSKQKREILQKRTLTGPHFDDYKIITNDKELKFFGSQGEIRLFVLALKIAHVIYIKKETGNYPILLLDDISSELDTNKKKFLFNFLKKIDSQIFITTTTPKHIPNLESESFLEIKNGKTYWK